MVQCLSVNKHLLSPYCVPGTVLSTGDTNMKKKDSVYLQGGMVVEYRALEIANLGLFPQIEELSNGLVKRGALF